MKYKDILLAAVRDWDDFTCKNVCEELRLVENDTAELPLDLSQNEFYLPAWLGRNGWRPIIGTNALSFSLGVFQLDLEPELEIFNIWNSITRREIVASASIPKSEYKAKVFFDILNLEA